MLRQFRFNALEDCQCARRLSMRSKIVNVLEDCQCARRLSMCSKMVKHSGRI